MSAHMSRTRKITAPKLWVVLAKYDRCVADQMWGRHFTTAEVSALADRIVELEGVLSDLGLLVERRA